MSRGGRGGARGGKPSPFTPQLMAGLSYNDIINQSKQGHIHYPKREMPNTDLATGTEVPMGEAYNRMVEEQKYTPYWLDAPQQASSRVPLYSDQFNRATTTVGGSSNHPLQALKESRRVLPRELLPSGPYAAVFDQGPQKNKANGNGKAGGETTKKVMDRVEAGGDAEEEDEEEEGEGIEEDEDYEDENDYGDNYFDGGEDDGGEGGDALGGGGDEDGGTFD